MTAPADEPQFEALHAQCRAAGIDLMRAKDWHGQPVYIASRWGLMKELPTLRAVAEWLEFTGQGRASR